LILKSPNEGKNSELLAHFYITSHTKEEAAK
jgi:hypothetical protein